MRQNFIALTFLLISCFAIGQKTKTTFLNSYWNETEKENPEYYQELTKVSSKNYKVEHYYISGQLQMSGHYVDKKMDTEIGEFNFYDSLGNIRKTKFYVDGFLDGVQKEFYADGTLKRSENYSMNDRQGEYQEYYEDKSIRAEANFVDDKIRGIAQRFSIDGSIVLRMEIDTNGTGQSKAYYINGDLRKEGSFESGFRLGIWNL